MKRAVDTSITIFDEFSIQNRIRTTEGHERAQNTERLEKLKAQLAELEKQYEKSKPLVNLVDNMVKLGSLYRGGNSQRYPNETTTLDRLEFNQRVQERRLLQEEQRQWERMSPNQAELQVNFDKNLEILKTIFMFNFSLFASHNKFEKAGKIL